MKEEDRLGTQWTYFKETQRKAKSAFWWAAYIYEDIAKVRRRKWKEMFNLGSFSNSHLNAFSGVGHPAAI